MIKYSKAELKSVNILVKEVDLELLRQQKDLLELLLLSHENGFLFSRGDDEDSSADERLKTIGAALDDGSAAKKAYDSFMLCYGIQTKHTNELIERTFTEENERLLLEMLSLVSGMLTSVVGEDESTAASEVPLPH